MEKGTKWLIISLAVFTFGVIAGSTFGVYTAPEPLYNYFKELSQGEIKPVIASALMGAFLWWLGLFLSAFFRFGIASASLITGAKGFVDGFAVTAILRILGFQGIGMCFFDCLGAPCMIVMSAIVTSYLSSDDGNTARFLLKSVIILFLSLVAAMLASLLSGAITGRLLAGVNF